MALDIWGQEIAQVAKVEVGPAMIFEDLPQMVQALNQREVDFVALPFVDYFKMKNSVELEPVLAGTLNGKPGEEYALIVHRSAPWTDLKHLQGKKLLVQESSGAASISLLWLDTLLLRQKLPIGPRFFLTVKKVEKSSQAVLPVLFKQADACLVPGWAFDTMVELNPQVGNELRIIVLSPLLGRGALFMRKNLAPHKRAMVDAALKLQNSKRVQQLTTLFHSERLVAFESVHLKSTADLYEEHRTLSKQR